MNCDLAFEHMRFIRNDIAKQVNDKVLQDYTFCSLPIFTQIDFNYIRDFVDKYYASRFDVRADYNGIKKSFFTYIIVG